jgi:lipid-A-disaccharide synthase
VWVFAGEPSGDALGARVLRALRREADARNDPITKIEGVGGPAMTRAGLPASLFPMSEVSVMGASEILRSLPLISRRLFECVEAVQTARPDVLLTVDSKGFSFRLAARANDRNGALTKTHVVSPSWWAWRGGEWNLRSRFLNAGYDAVACLLPFEPEGLMRVTGVHATFVGHPVVEEVAETAERFREAKANRSAGAKNHVNLCLLPGSRDQELDAHLPLFRATCGILKRTWFRNETPGETDARSLRVSFLTLPRHAERVRKEIQTWPLQATVTVLDAGDSESRAVFFAAADASLTCSGTATAQVFAFGVPQVVTYRARFLTETLGKLFAKTPHASLPNITLRRAAVPELLGSSATPAALADALTRVALDPDARNAQSESRDEFLDRLTPRDRLGVAVAPSVAIARAVLDAVDVKRRGQGPARAERFENDEST